MLRLRAAKYLMSNVSHSKLKSISTLCGKSCQRLIVKYDVYTCALCRSLHRAIDRLNRKCGLWSCFTTQQSRLLQINNIPDALSWLSCVGTDPHHRCRAHRSTFIRCCFHRKAEIALLCCLTTKVSFSRGAWSLWSPGDPNNTVNHIVQRHWIILFFQYNILFLSKKKPFKFSKTQNVKLARPENLTKS